MLKALTGLPGKLNSKPQSHIKVTRFSHVLEYMKLTLCNPFGISAIIKPLNSCCFPDFLTGL